MSFVLDDANLQLNYLRFNKFSLQQSSHFLFKSEVQMLFLLQIAPNLLVWYFYIWKEATKEKLSFEETYKALLQLYNRRMYI